jgi:hypothetical protein
LPPGIKIRKIRIAGLSALLDSASRFLAFRAIAFHDILKTLGVIILIVVLGFTAYLIYGLIKSLTKKG